VCRATQQQGRGGFGPWSLPRQAVGAIPGSGVCGEFDETIQGAMENLMAKPLNRQ
jgi:hypothetical protein